MCWLLSSASMLLLIDFGLKSLLGRLLAEDILEEEREREATRIKADISSPVADRTLRGETGPQTSDLSKFQGL